MHWKDRDTFVLASGKEVDAIYGMIGINADLGIGEGSDGSIGVDGFNWADPPIPPWTTQERAELADYMIGLWQRFKDTSA